MYTKREAKRMLNQVKSIMLGGTYGELERSSDYNLEELERLALKLEGMIR